MNNKWLERFELKPGRWVFTPTPESRAKGEELKALVLQHWKLPKFFYHLRDGGHVAALRAHQKHKLFFKLDISDFFGTVHRNRLSRALKPMVGHAKALDLAEASTVKHPTHGRSMLPYGFVQSPMLASLVLDQSAFGVALRELNEDAALCVSVYVDDIIVSGEDLAVLLAAMESLKAIAAKSKFELNEAKEVAPTASLEVFNILLTAGEPLVVTPARMTEFVEALQHATADEAAGILGYVRSVNPEQADELAEHLPLAEIGETP